ncbi:carboxymuconolactone decarboxylase family protein [Streptomyces roseirectus]|uniref:Carboxymuconolactone decarboxylase family protein n=1 Tax=Streptomyces roseirectus TaxID=2768066 RepID=A0A7H0IQ33_9ACTN|nr:carboxymuconolactone decarboxylase family protein [Streptomyces roseirectus]QNP74899.1 carboxymuconolactone decarboxylase family protein [Streptomyces roseirectus]
MAKDDDRYRRGLHRMEEIGGARVTADFLAALSGTAPDLGRYVAEFIYGDLYCRPGLALPERQLVTVATLAALGGCERQLALHIGVALDAGVTPATLVEALIHQCAYAGFPRALNAVAVAREVFTERGVPLPPQARETVRGGDREWHE